MSEQRDPMSDERLRRALLARAESTPLTADERNDILRASRRSLEGRQPRAWLGGLRAAVVGLAAVVVLLVVASPLLLTAPAASPSSPTAPVSNATPSAVSPEPSSAVAQLHLYSAQELADMVGDAAWIGKTVLADAAVAEVTGPPGAFESPGVFACQPPDACRLGGLLPSSLHVPVLVGWRDAPKDVGQPYDDGSGTRWLTRVSFPSADGVSAFTVRSDALELLGPVRVPESGSTWTTDGVGRVAGDASDEVYAVDAWLVEGMQALCPADPALFETPAPAQDYFCFGSWLTSTEERAITSRNDSGFEGRLSFDGLQVQAPAYAGFADEPQHDDYGAVPRRAVYLVRNAGCPPAAMFGCPVYRLLARLSDAASTPPPTATPPPTTTPPQSTP